MLNGTVVVSPGAVGNGATVVVSGCVNGCVGGWVKDWVDVKSVVALNIVDEVTPVVPVNIVPVNSGVAVNNGVEVSVAVEVKARVGVTVEVGVKSGVGVGVG